MAIKNYADAGSNLFKDIIEKRNAEIKVVNMSLTIDEKIYQCYEDDINVDQFSHSFYQKMREGSKIDTSQVTPYTYEEAFRKDVEDGHQIKVKKWSISLIVRPRDSVKVFKPFMLMNQ